MKEIKFRAWDKQDNKMYEKQAVDEDGYAVDINGDEAYSNEPFRILMQYTGLKDKNGVEIYEGDIVKYNLSFPVGEIVFNRDRFTPIYDRSSYDEWELDFWRISDKCEVIGNVYETPELLDWEHIQTLELLAKD
jgi:uncharacterized phage protein (TIGR01671 family)